jgi:hypothetical protein
MRPDIERLVEGQRRDLRLGAALAALPQPELPDDVDARLRAAVEKERRRNQRRPGWPELLAVLLLVAVVGGALAWRYVPPSSSTMDQVRSAIELRRDSLIPTPPKAAIARGRMTVAERAALEKQVARSIAASCTPRFALEQVVDGHAPRNAVQVTANALASGADWPAPVAQQPIGDPTFVRRNWGGSIVVRIVEPLLGQVEDIGDLYVFRRVEGRWLIDEIVHQGA